MGIDRSVEGAMVTAQIPCLFVFSKRDRNSSKNGPGLDRHKFIFEQ